MKNAYKREDKIKVMKIRKTSFEKIRLLKKH